MALNQTVYLWNASSGDIQELMSVQGDDYVSSISWAADGKHVAVGLSNSLTQIWDAERAKPVRNLTGHAARVSALSWNQHILSTGGRDSLILNHDVRVREHVTATLRGHEQEVCGLKWSPNGTQVRLAGLRRRAQGSAAAAGLPSGSATVCGPMPHPTPPAHTPARPLLPSPLPRAAGLGRQRQPADDLGRGQRPRVAPHHGAPGGGQGPGLVPLPGQPAGHRRRHCGPHHQVPQHPHGCARLPGVPGRLAGWGTAAAAVRGVAAPCERSCSFSCPPAPHPPPPPLAGALLNSIDTGSQVCSLQWNRHERELLSSHGFRCVGRRPRA